MLNLLSAAALPGPGVSPIPNFALPVSRGPPWQSAPPGEDARRVVTGGWAPRAWTPLATGGGEGRPQGPPPRGKRPPSPGPSLLATPAVPDARPARASTPPAPASGSPAPPPRAPGPGAPRASAVASRQRCYPDAVSSGGPGPPAPEPGAAVPAPRRSGASATHHRPPPPRRPRPPGGPATPPTLTAAALAAAAVFVHLEAAAAAGEPGAGGRGAAGAERAGGRAAPAARGPGRGPGLLPRGGALSAPRRRHVARRPRPGRGGRGPAGPPRERARPRPETPARLRLGPRGQGPGSEASRLAQPPLSSSLWTDVGSGAQNPATRGLGGWSGGVLLARVLSEKAQETYLKVKPSSLVRRHFRVIPAFQPFLGCHGGSPFLAMSAL